MLTMTYLQQASVHKLKNCENVLFSMIIVALEEQWLQYELRTF